MILLVYGPGSERHLINSFAPADLALNAQHHVDRGGAVRFVTGTDLENVTQLSDERLPLTLEAFDSAYPDHSY